MMKALIEALPAPGCGMSGTPDEKYELYRVILDYEALQDGFLDRIDDLNTTISAVPGFADGALQKLLTKNPGKAIARPRDHRSASNARKFGWESLGRALEKTGMALVLVIDDARFAPIKEQLTKRARPRKPAIARMARPAWLFKRKRAREMGKKRWEGVSDSKRKRLAKRAAKARWSKPRPATASSLGATASPAPHHDSA